MLLAILLSLLGLCATGDAAVAGHQLLQSSSNADAPLTPLSPSDLVIVYITTLSRLPLVHATRPARRGVRTFIVVQNASQAAHLNDLHGGPHSQHSETYLAWPDPDNGGRSDDGRGSGGPYGRAPPSGAHPLHALGPAWAMAPVLVHAAVLASSATPSSAASAESRSAPQLLPYRWILVARDDTLWRLRHAVRLLSQLDAGVAAAVSDHLIDFNGRRLLAPSPAAAVCLPCATNLTALLGRRHPPGVPQPACPVCRPASGCEFRFDLCGGLAGGPHCASKRFLGSGDRCSHSWVAGGAGAALSGTLLSYLNMDDWAGCVRGQRPSTGERSLARCLWRNGFAFTHPATGLSEGLTKEVFSDTHMQFGNPLLRQDVFGPSADTLMAPWYRADQEAAATAMAAAAATAPSPMVIGGGMEAAAVATSAVLSSTRLRAQDAPACDADCHAWLARSGVSVHLDVPYIEGVDVAAAAAMLQKAAEAEAEAEAAAKTANAASN